MSQVPKTDDAIVASVLRGNRPDNDAPVQATVAAVMRQIRVALPSDPGRSMLERIKRELESLALRLPDNSPDAAMIRLILDELD